jgi:hypothetical protein
VFITARPQQAKANVTTTTNCDRSSDCAIKRHAQVQAGRLGKIAVDPVLSSDVNARHRAARDNLHGDGPSAIGANRLPQRTDDQFHSAVSQPLLDPGQVLAALSRNSSHRTEPTPLSRCEFFRRLDHGRHTYPCTRSTRNGLQPLSIRLGVKPHTCSAAIVEKLAAMEKDVRHVDDCATSRILPTPKAYQSHTPYPTVRIGT